MTPILCLISFFVILALAAATDGDDGGKDKPDFSGFGGNQPCPGFRCSAGYSPVQKSRSKFVSSGCSKMSGGMMMMAAESGNEIYSACCDRWHACYQTCGAAKQVCDDGFKSCATEMCGGDEECKKSADMKSLVVGLGGCQFYDEGQRRACECVKKEKREEKRAAALRSFYKKFAPDSLAKVDALAKKVDSTSKLAAVFRKLHVKYPESIEVVVVEDEMARLQRMMKSGQFSSEFKGDGEDRVEDVEDDEDAGETEEL